MTTPARKPFEWVGGWLALDFINTVTWVGGDDLVNERLLTFFDLVEWGRSAGFLTSGEARGLALEGGTHPERAGRALNQAHRLRRVLHDVFVATASGEAVGPTPLSQFNRFLDTALARLTLQLEGDRWSWTWRREEDDLEQVLPPIVKSAAELLTAPDRALLKHCASDDCGWLFLDRSRNHTRRWCDMKVCGNSEKARRFYRKRKEGESHKSQVAGHKSRLRALSP